MKQNPNIESFLDASAAGDLERVREIVRSGQDVNEAGKANRRAICAGGRGDSQVKIAEYLLEQGADVNAPCYGGASAVALTASASDLVFLRWLLDHGADPHWICPVTGNTTLHSATIDGTHPEATACVELLLAAGVDPNCKNIPGKPTGEYWRDVKTLGETPLHRAAASGDEQMIRALLDAGADPSILDVNGQSALTRFSLYQRDRETATAVLDPSMMCLLAYNDELKKSVSYWEPEMKVRKRSGRCCGFYPS